MRRLTGVIQPYAWGSPSVIPELLGREPSGEPQAELWLGAHPLAPALADGEPLDEVLDADPVGLIGAASVEAFGPRLPYLLKVIAADQPLSLQAHPSRAQAEAGYEREQAAGIPRDAPNRTYKDGWPKPEVLCALVPTEALCGFRDPETTYALFEQLQVPAALDLIAPLTDREQPPAARLAHVFERLLRLSKGTDVIAEVVTAAERLGSEADRDRFAQTARELNAFYPGDPGILAALLMNRVTLQPQQALFLPAGNLHAYLRGAGVEIMANSDNVMRGGLTPKYVDVDELLAVLDFSPMTPALVTGVEEYAGVWRYPDDAPEFALWRVEVTGSPIVLPGDGLGRIVLVTAGELAATHIGSESRLVKGESAFLAASDTVTASGHGTLFVAGPGVL